MPKDSSENKKSHKNEQAVEEMYKKKDQRQHVLDLPDTYIGSIEQDTANMWTYDTTEKIIVKQDITYVPGFYKTCDELIVNARDETIRSKNCNKIKIKINKEEGFVSVWNNGSGIPVALHKEHNVYVPELIFGHLLTSSNYDQKGKIVGGKNGYGAKCLRNDTRVPLYDGSVVRADEVELSDKLIGDDGKVRNIKKIISGEGKLYKIEQANGEPYYVNDQHILTLHMPDHKVIFWSNTKNSWNVLWWDNEKQHVCKKYITVSKITIQCPECGIELAGHLGRHYARNHKGIEVPIVPRKPPTIIAPDILEVKLARTQLEKFCESIPDNNVFDISVQDYMKFNKTTKSRLAGIRGQCVDWKKSEVVLDPYVLGLWLGDGFSCGYGYACYGEKDPELIDYLRTWGVKNDACLKHYRKYDYGFSSIDHFREKGYAPLKKLLDQYDLVKNKHVPIEYIVNDRETRLKVLAGFIDTDGTAMRDGTQIIICQGLLHKQLIEDITFLARSLGFYASLTMQKSSHTTSDGTKKRKLCYHLNISGNIEDIPTLLNRKKCKNILKHSPLTTGHIKVSDAGVGKYVGFEIDNNQRFVINDFTVTHNCANIFSNRFIVETVDAKSRKKYIQEFSKNMSEKTEPIITNVSKDEESYVQITYYPDFHRFGMKGLSNDVIGLLKKRAYDIAACTDKNVKVYLNNELLNVKDFQDFIGLHYSKKPDLVYEEVNARWKIGVVFAQDAGNDQVSFVNGVWTYQGGTHVDYIAQQIVKKVTEHVKSKHKGLNVKPAQIREHLNFFIDAVIDDPSFSSQTKGELTTKVANFGTTCELDSGFIAKIVKTGLVEIVVKNAQFKEMSSLKNTDGKKVTSLRDIPKLEDAHWAGSRKSSETRLILTEGDSAKSYAISGLSIIGREKYGVFPLKGKLLNVRNATAAQIKKNVEFCQLKKIMGLKQSTVYNDTKKLRYGGILILTDQDSDGSHIKGLIINMFQYFWPELLKIKGFIQTISTPLIKAFKKTDTKKKSPLTFYTFSEFEKWQTDEMKNDLSKWRIKYYKGLGTSDEKEAKEVFNDFKNRLITFMWEKVASVDTDSKDSKNKKSIKDKNDDIDSDDKSDVESNDSNKDDDKDDDKEDSNDPTIYESKSYDALTLAFDEKRANDRKRWLAKHDRHNILEYTNQNVSYSDFVNKDLIHFSNDDNIRSLPSLIDGQKPSQRKILYACFKKDQRSEIKVAQLASYVSEHTAYKHGEKSLEDTIIGMAQRFAGSNNIYLLHPSGNFGFRKQGGDEHASSRYIFTNIEPLTYKIFRKEDESILNYIEDEGEMVEPEYYYPIIPMILVNGGHGVGTGFSTNVPQYNPADICENLLRRLANKEMLEMDPWYNGFTGDVKRIEEGKYKITGKFELINDDTVKITEIPIKGFYCWIDKYLDFLNGLAADGKKVANVVTHCGNNKIDIDVEFANGELQKMVKKGNEEIEKFLKLIANMSVSNLYLYNHKNEITHYESPLEIMEEFFEFRLKMYSVRKKRYLKLLNNQLEILKNKVKFINDILSDKIIINKKKKSEIIAKLEQLKYPQLSNKIDATEEEKSYRYLTDMTLFSLTIEKIDELNEEYNNKKKEFDDYNSTTEVDLWKRELEEFSSTYKQWLVDRDEDENDDDNINTKKGKKSKKSVVKSSEKTKTSEVEKKPTKVKKHK